MKDPHVLGRRAGNIAFAVLVLGLAALPFACRAQMAHGMGPRKPLPAATPAPSRIKLWWPLVQQVAREEGAPHLAAVTYAYCAQESGMDPRQYFRANGMTAVGLCSAIQEDNPRYSVAQLMEPRTNITLTIREMKQRWQGDPVTTAAVVFTPRWLRGTGPAGGWQSKHHYMAAIRRRMAQLNEQKGR